MGVSHRIQGIRREREREMCGGVEVLYVWEASLGIYREETSLSRSLALSLQSCQNADFVSFVHI